MNKISTGVKRIIMYHIMFVFVGMLAMPVLSNLGDTTGSIVGGIAAFLYILMLYSIGWNLGKSDSRRTADTLNSDSPKYLHGEALTIRFNRMVKASLFATIPTLFLLALRIFVPMIFSDTMIPFGSEAIEVVDGYVIAYETILQPISWFFDIGYRIWLMPFITFFRGFDYGITLSYILPIFFAPIFVPIGFKVGVTRFSILEKLVPKLVYKKREKEDVKK